VTGVAAGLAGTSAGVGVRGLGAPAPVYRGPGPPDPIGRARTVRTGVALVPVCYLGLEGIQDLLS